MKCPKCGFNSFEYLDSCKKCGNDLLAFKMSLGIQPVVMPPGVFAGQDVINEELSQQLTMTPEVAAALASSGDEFEFESAAAATAEPPPAPPEEAAFGEISFDETGGDATSHWGGSEPTDGFSGQEFAGFDTEPATLPEMAKDDSFGDIFGKDGGQPVEKKAEDDFFNSPELADLFKDEPAEKK
jgi:hypothetical protein